MAGEGERSRVNTTSTQDLSSRGSDARYSRKNIFRKDLLKGPMMILSTTIGGSRVKDVMV